MQHLNRIILAFLLLLEPMATWAQTRGATPENYDNMSLEELMNVKITVASVKELTPRESPGIITYITAEEIRNSGARDLMEVLRQVPGFEFGVDVEGVVGVAIRGNWAHEGKIVLFIDGIEMNESLYSTLQFGSHYPTDNIERIEIIRGPGSALHGGYAAYAVIKIITKSAKEQEKQVAANVTQSTTQNGVSNSNTSVYFSKKGNKNGFTIHLNGNQSVRSHQIYKDVFGDSYDMSQNSDLKNLYVNASGNIGRLQLRVLYDNYEIQSRDNYVEIDKKVRKNLFVSHNIEAKYEINVNEKLKFVPLLLFSKQLPWNTTSQPGNADGAAFRIKATSILGSIHSVYEANKK